MDCSEGHVEFARVLGHCNGGGGDIVRQAIICACEGFCFWCVESPLYVSVKPMPYVPNGPSRCVCSLTPTLMFAQR